VLLKTYWFILKNLMTYFDTLRLMVALEKEAEKDFAFDALKKISVNERAENKVTLKKVLLVEKNQDGVGTTLIFERPEHSDWGLPFQLGDWVGLEGPHPDSLTQVMTGVVTEISDDFIWMHAGNKFPEEVRGGRWHLSKVSNESTWKKVLRALDLMEKTENRFLAHLRAVILGDKPRKKEPFPLESFFNPDLNDSQKQAVKHALEEQELAVIWGPPGTGKTTVLVEIVRQAVRAKQKVLVTTPSNLALDTLLEKLMQAGLSCVRVGPDEKVLATVRPSTFQALRKSHPNFKEVSAFHREIKRLVLHLQKRKSREYIPNPEYRSFQQEIRQLYQQAKILEKNSRDQILREAEVIASTHAGFPEDIKLKKLFDLTVLDEASQANTPLSWVPIAMSKKVVFAGDPCQLPPTYLNEKVMRGKFDLSLLESLLKRFPDSAFLNLQYRMNEALQAWSSRMFYKNELRPHAKNATQNLMDLITLEPSTSAAPIVFIDTVGTNFEFEEKQDEDSDSFFNTGEATLCSKLLLHYLECGLKPEHIGVITPYSAQARYIRKMLEPVVLDVSTVDSFQGREKEVIFVSFVRSSPKGETGFLKEIRRVNVTFTRAKRQLVVIGDSSTLTRVSFLKDFMNTLNDTASWHSAWEWAE
jgi:superfamily I DNA and/or RNA helicase